LLSGGVVTSKKFQYGEIKVKTRAELEKSLASGDPSIVCEAMFSAAQHESDWRWSQAQCLRMLGHKLVTVRSAALMALSEIALYRGHLDFDVVLPQIQQLENDPELEPLVKDALDNIRVAKNRHAQLGADGHS
jgi:predicted secreted Zn-dependent protease